MPKSKKPTLVTGDNAAIMSPRAYADRLYRAANECIRQRQRYSRLVAAGTSEEEQASALQVASMCDEILLKEIGTFEKTAAGSAHRDEEWFRKSTALWAAAREYERRHKDCDTNSRKMMTHSKEHLVQLATEFDLEASALLALQHAVSAYKKAVPDADFDATTKVA